MSLSVKSYSFYSFIQTGGAIFLGGTYRNYGRFPTIISDLLRKKIIQQIKQINQYTNVYDERN